ncbi:ABC transporter permease subunit, partial [Paraburkholderia sp. BR14319]|uniref:ABC transporter permease subunit n=1 Tax=Paraburkholderia sp. BR14319 TaxID=3237005 RepID=UPI0034D245AF
SEAIAMITLAFAWTQVPFNFVIFVAALRSIPQDYLAAAAVDGAGPVRFFFDILLPLSKTNFAALGTIVFISTWKDYMWPLLM